jgi:hypothetical protein
MLFHSWNRKNKLYEDLKHVSLKYEVGTQDYLTGGRVHIVLLS